MLTVVHKKSSNGHQYSYVIKDDCTYDMYVHQELSYAQGRGKPHYPVPALHHSNINVEKHSILSIRTCMLLYWTLEAGKRYPSRYLFYSLAQWGMIE